MNRSPHLRATPPLVRAALVAATLLLASCADDAVGPPSPALMVIHSGDGQTARTGTEAPEPVRVRVTGEGGASVSGVAVTFDVTAGGGSVPSSSAMTDANGIASPGRWTMGRPGPQELRASVPDVAPVVFSATSLGTPAEIAVAAGADQQATVATSVPVPPEVVVTDSSGAPVAGVVVAFAPDGGSTVASAEVSTNAQGRAGPGSWTLGTEAGTYRLSASVDGAGVAGNPVRIEAVALPGPAAALTVVAGDEQESETTLPVAVAPVVRVADAYGNPVADAEVAFSASGDSEVSPRRTNSNDEGLAAVAHWVLGRSAGTTYRLAASIVLDDGSQAAVTFSATARAAVYDIEIAYVGGSQPTSTQLRAFERSERFWERAITGNLEWSTVRKPELDDCLARSEIDATVPDDRIVDDLLIYVQIRYIDGRGGVFGGAGPCFIRESNSLPIVGTIFLDLADLEGLESNGHLEGTILHEMAHVLGFGGNFWEHLGLLHDPAGRRANADTQFTGDSAFAAFSRVRGDHYADAEHVPVQNIGGEGVWNGHWREFVFRHELMTPFPDAGPNPLSEVTIASLIDLGYPGVDVSVSDDYMMPPPLFADAAERTVDPDQAAAVHPADHALKEHAHRMGFADDILRIPVAVIDRDGRVVRVLPAGRR